MTMQNFKVDRIDSFSEIEREWKELLERALFKTIFQTFEWNDAWWKHLQRENKLFLIGCWKEKSLVGIAPLMIQQMKIKSVPAFKILNFIGCPESDYHDFILDRDYARESLNAIFSHLKKYRAKWSILRLPEMPEDSPTHEILKDVFVSNRIYYEKFQHTPCPYVNLPKTFEEYKMSLSRETRRKLVKNMNRINRKGEVRFEISDWNDIEEFFMLNSKRWQSVGQSGSLPEDELKNFHREVACRLSNYLDLCFLSIDGRKIAVLYSYDYENIRCVYLQGMDMEYEYYSPGITLIVNRIQDAINKKMKNFDFMRGDEEYKFHYAKTVKYNQQYFISHSKLLLKSFLAIEKMAEKIK